MFLFSLIGLGCFITNINSAINTIVDAIKQVYDIATESISIFTNNISTSFNNILNMDIDSLVNELFENKYISNSFNGALEAAIGNLDTAGDVINNALNTSLEYVSVGIVLLIVDILIGIILGYYFTKWFIRTTTLKRTFKEELRSFLYGLPLLIIEIILCINIYNYLSDYIWICIIIGLLIFIVGSLLKAYLIQRNKDIKLSKVLNIKNILLLLLSDVIVLMLGFGIGYIFLELIDSFISILLFIPCIEISLIDISFMSESFVYNELKVIK